MHTHTHTSSLQHELPLQSLAQTTCSDVICLKEQTKKLLLCVETYICHSAQTFFTNPKSRLCPFTSQTHAHFWLRCVSDVYVVCSDMHIYYIYCTYVCVCAPQTSNPKSKQTTLTQLCRYLHTTLHKMFNIRVRFSSHSLSLYLHMYSRGYYGQAAAQHIERDFECIMRARTVHAIMRL